MAELTLSTLDRLSQRSSMTVGAADGDISTAVGALVTALEAVILGSDLRAVQTTPTVIDAGSAVPPADENANRNNKWLFRFQDSTTAKIYSHEIGTADNTALPSPTTDFLDLSAGVGLALKTAFDAVWKSPVGNAGVLLSVQQVNRNG